ncbi:MAG TPA: hypothetical protein VHX37_00195 [Acidobacteriaceae bacterium]|jgi:hypothetical protein|nr:hypothetical protein [Acidobacteriaceae bacterium]
MIRRILGWVGEAVKVLLVAAVVVYGVDWGVFEVRAAHGTGYDTVQVEQYLSTPLKGSKTEYDYMGTATENCARALFPHGGAPACWWLKKHTTQWE